MGASFGDVICKKCANNSFAHLENQLVDSAGDVVDSADVSNESVFALLPEIVPLSQFARAGKRGHYLSAGVVMLE